MGKPRCAPERGRLRGRDPPLGRLLRWNSSGWPLEVGDPPYSGRWGNPMLLGMELPIGAVKRPPGTPGMLSGKVGPPEQDTASHCLVSKGFNAWDYNMTTSPILASLDLHAHLCCKCSELDFLSFGTYQA